MSSPARASSSEPVSGPGGAASLRRAALAEAWHVDGDLARAAAAWAELAGDGGEPAEAALKAAISCFAAGDEAAGLEWIERARGAGAPPEEVLYVLAQRSWGGGDALRALDLLEEAARRDPRSGRAVNLRGVLLLRLGASGRARAHFAEALARDPDDACALANQISADIDAMGALEAEAALRRAARSAPHRVEPHVLHARLRRRAGDEAGARLGLTRARLRQRSLWPPEDRAAAGGEALPPLARAAVTGRLSEAGASLSVSLTFEGEPPLGVFINAGYTRVSLGGAASRPAEPPPGAAPRIAAPAAYHEIPERLREAARAGAPLAITLEGRPLPPCARLTADEIELDGLSAWLPLAAPERRTLYRLDIELPPGFRAFAPSPAPEPGGPGLLALRAPREASLPDGIVACGRTPLGDLRAAAAAAYQAQWLWLDLLGPACAAARAFAALPPVVLVDRPGSRFCYARAGYLRIPSGLAGTGELAPLLTHEVGHAGFGIAARFAPGSELYAEALAEYSLHLAEDAGVVPGYRAPTLAALAALGGGELPSAGLAAMARGPGRRDAYVLRAKGGFMVAALRGVMGDAPFRDLLRAVLELGGERPIGGYELFAVASRLHGASLGWFANQWIHAGGELGFAVEPGEIRREGAGHLAHFTVRCAGAAVPGAPVRFDVECEGGERVSAHLDLDLGVAHAAVITPSRPRAVRPDPERRWYASPTPTPFPSTP